MHHEIRNFSVNSFNFVTSLTDCCMTLAADITDRFQQLHTLLGKEGS